MTRKEMQIKVNREVMSNWAKAKEVWNSVPNTAVTRIDPNGVLVDVLRLVYGYTATSAKHVAKFRNMFTHCYEITYRECAE